MTMIEKVARALDPSVWQAADAGMINPTGKQMSLDAARRAIEVMREPSDKMMEAGWTRQFINVGASPDDATTMASLKMADHVEVQFLMDGWGAAIDAALNEE